MLFESKTIPLRDGRSALLRAPERGDAAAMLEYLKLVAGETDFIVRTPEECTDTLESEVRFIEGTRNSPDRLMIFAFVDGELAGNCSLGFNSRKKTAHRATIGIAIKQRYWNLGLGTAFFTEMIAVAEARGISHLELEFIEGNSRAQALYEKMGFRIVGIHPEAIRLADGTLANEYLMVKKLV